MDKNNIFGLWNHKKQEYYKYDTWQLSIGGYKRGIQYKYDASKYKDYYEFLEKIGYASNPNYIPNIKGQMRPYMSRTFQSTRKKESQKANMRFVIILAILGFVAYYLFYM